MNQEPDVKYLTIGELVGLVILMGFVAWGIGLAGAAALFWGAPL